MARALLLGVVVLGGLPLTAAAQAQQFAIELKVQAGKESKTARTVTAVVGFKLKPRDVLKLKSGERVKVRWTLKDVDAQAAFKNVMVHFFAVELDRAGQTTLPKLDKGVVAESALVMDFRPKDQTEGEMSFVIAQPGAYLLRLETIGARVDFGGHEYFAALDLVVE